MKIPSYTAPFLTLTSHVAPWEETKARLEVGVQGTVKTPPTRRGGDREEEETTRRWGKGRGGHREKRGDRMEEEEREQEETERKETYRSEQHSPPQR